MFVYNCLSKIISDLSPKQKKKKRVEEEEEEEEEEKEKKKAGKNRKRKNRCWKMVKIIISIELFQKY